MGEFFHAVRVFFDQLAGVGWTALAIGLAIHFARLLTRTVAWRNILAASYPDVRWRWRSVAQRVPRRGRDQLDRAGPRGRRGQAPPRPPDQPATTYTTLASTLVTETLLDLVLATAIFTWALTQGVLPSLHVLPSIPAFDWGWLFRNQRVTAIAVVALTVGAIWFLHWASAARRELQAARRPGLRDPARPGTLRTGGRELAAAQLGAADRLALLVPARLPRARLDPQRAARPGGRQPLDAAAVLTRRRRDEAGVARLRAPRPGLERDNCSRSASASTSP